MGKEKVSAGTASLNKYVTTVHAHTSVPVTKEHAVIEREPSRQRTTSGLVRSEAISRCL